MPSSRQVEHEKRRGSPPVRHATPKVAQNEFVRRELSAAETTAYRLWRSDAEAVFEVLDETIEAGYKFSLRYDDYSRSPSCICFPPEDSDNSGLLLSGRGGSAYRALAECLYKHSVLLSGLWSSGGRPGDTERDADW